MTMTGLANHQQQFLEKNLGKNDLSSEVREALTQVNNLITTALEEAQLSDRFSGPYIFQGDISTNLVNALDETYISALKYIGITFEENSSNPSTSTICLKYDSNR